jgi:hypothetical protein
MRFPGQFSLGLRVVETRPTSDSTDTLYPLGDIPGTNEEFYVSVAEGGGVHNIYAWNESTDAWRAVSADIAAAPRERGTVFRGSAANAALYVPQGASGYTYLRTTGAGTVNETNNTGVDARSMAVWDNRLWAIGTDGVIQYSLDGATFTTLRDPRTGGDLTLDPAHSPNKLLAWFNLAGQSALFCVTDKAVWGLNLLGKRWEFIYELPPHALAGVTAAVWRSTQDLHVGLGGSIIRRTPSGVDVPLSGPGADGDGLPAGYLGSVWDLCPEWQNLYCLMYPRATQQASLLARNDHGWFPVWVDPTASRDARWCAVSKASSAYRLWWGVASYAYTVELRAEPYGPRQGYAAGFDKFNSQDSFETGRFWAQTWGYEKLAARLEVYADHATADENIEVSTRPTG